MRDHHCFGHTGRKKKVFETRADAARWLREKSIKGGTFGIYRCSDCGKFHLHKNQKPTRRRGRR
jgi:hypothetical protein